MNIKETTGGGKIKLVLEGKFDAVSAPGFEKDISGKLEGITDILIDLGAVEYISSAGLRALLFLQQTMDEVNGKLAVSNVPEIVMNIFEVTGFCDIITII